MLFRSVYLGHRRFLLAKHPLRKKGKHFNGQADHQPKPTERTGADVFRMVKDLKVIFGKGPGGVSIPKDADGRAPMWKKNSIFLGATLFEIPRGPQCNRRDACDEESLCEPARLLGHVWEDKRYTGSTADRKSVV